MSGYIAGVDVGGSRCIAVVIDADNNIVAESRITTPDRPDALVATMDKVVRELVAVAGSIDAAGFGIPGQLDLDGRVRFIPNLIDIGELAIQDRLEDLIKLPIHVDNNANCAARAELDMGAARGVRDAVMITLGTGLGNSIIVDGEVQRGAHGLAGELGHCMIDPNGPRCSCGRTGCFELFASWSGLKRLAQEAARAGQAPNLLTYTDGDVEILLGEHVLRGVRDGQADAKAVLNRFSWWLAAGLANVVALLDPELIVLGGGLVADWDLYKDFVDDHYRGMVLAGEHREPVRIEPAAMGERAGALGAALAARSLVPT